MVHHLPSPKAAQKYRYSHLYEGSLDDNCAKAIRDCDPEGPLMMYISKMIPSADAGRFIAFGRVFSGTARVGQQVTILGPNFSIGSKKDVYETNIQGCELIMGRKREQVNSIQCGNTGALIGIDKFLVKNGTITDSKEAANIRAMKFSVSPVVRVAVEPVNPNDASKVIEGMRKLSKVDNLVVCTINESTGEKIIAGSGELHIEICLNDLEKVYAKVPIKRSKPIVPYKETVTISGEQCKSKSTNKHNKLTSRARKLNDESIQSVEDGLITPDMDKHTMSKLMVESYGFEKKEVASLWAFGPNTDSPNLLMEATEGCSYLKEIKDSYVRAFEEVCLGGVLADEPLRGVNFDLIDAVIHSDNAHRGAGQIIPCAKRVLYGSQLLAQPRILEPVYLLEVTCTENHISGVYSVISTRKGNVIDQISSMGSPVQIVKAYIPVAQSFDLCSDIRSKTSGQAFPSLVFSHWDVVVGDPLSQTDNTAKRIITEVRKRKGLKPEIPTIDEYLDKF